MYKEDLMVGDIIRMQAGWDYPGNPAEKTTAEVVYASDKECHVARKDGERGTGRDIKGYGRLWKLVKNDSRGWISERYNSSVGFVSRLKAGEKGKYHDPLEKIEISGHYQIGSDPEFFLKDKSGAIVPAHTVIGEKRTSAVSEDGYDGHGSYFPDGFALEINPQYDTCRQRLIRKKAVILKHISDAIAGGGFKIDFGRVGAEIPKDEYESAPNKIREYGCSPSLSAYKDKGLDENGTEHRMRYAGGHIHLSLTPEMKKDVNELVKMLDIVVGNTCVMIDRNNMNAKRREKYGRAGEYRVKPYGVEYRVLSNFWMRAPQTTSFVFALARLAMDIFSNQVIRDKFLADIDIELVRSAINSNSRIQARKTFNKLIELLEKHGHNQFEDAQINGLKKWVKLIDPMCIFPKEHDKVVELWEKTNSIIGSEQFLRTISSYKKVK